MHHFDTSSCAGVAMPFLPSGEDGVATPSLLLVLDVPLRVGAAAVPGLSGGSCNLEPLRKSEFAIPQCHHSGIRVLATNTLLRLMSQTRVPLSGLTPDCFRMFSSPGTETGREGCTGMQPSRPGRISGAIMLPVFPLFSVAMPCGPARKAVPAAVRSWLRWPRLRSCAGFAGRI